METCWHSHHFTLSAWKICPKPSTILRQSHHIVNYTCLTATTLNASQRQMLSLGYTPWTHWFLMAQKVKHLTTYSKTHATRAWGRRQMGIIRTPPKSVPTFPPFILGCTSCSIAKTVQSLLLKPALLLLVLVQVPLVSRDTTGETGTKLLILNTSPKSNLRSH